MSTEGSRIPIILDDIAQDPDIGLIRAMVQRRGKDAPSAALAIALAWIEELLKEHVRMRERRAILDKVAEKSSLEPLDLAFLVAVARSTARIGLLDGITDEELESLLRNAGVRSTEDLGKFELFFSE